MHLKIHDFRVVNVFNGIFIEFYRFLVWFLMSGRVSIDMIWLQLLQETLSPNMAEKGILEQGRTN